MINPFDFVLNNNPPLWWIILGITIIEIFFVLFIYNNKNVSKKYKFGWIELKLMAICAGTISLSILTFLGYFLFCIIPHCKVLLEVLGAIGIFLLLNYIIWRILK